MMERIREASPRLKARIAVAFYWLSVLRAVFAEFFALVSIDPRWSS